MAKEITAKQIELLEAYGKFLENHHYLDTDWWAEHPTAMEEFLKDYKFVLPEEKDDITKQVYGPASSKNYFNT